MSKRFDDDDDDEVPLRRRPRRDDDDNDDRPRRKNQKSKKKKKKKETEGRSGLIIVLASIGVFVLLCAAGSIWYFRSAPAGGGGLGLSSGIKKDIVAAKSKLDGSAKRLDYAIRSTPVDIKTCREENEKMGTMALKYRMDMKNWTVVPEAKPLVDAFGKYLDAHFDRHMKSSGIIFGPLDFDDRFRDKKLAKRDHVADTQRAQELWAKLCQDGAESMKERAEVLDKTLEDYKD